jgi:polyphosphate kinase
MIDRFNEMIDREIKNSHEGKHAHILIKVNNLQEREMIAKLYEASNEGVKIDLLVRSICCAAPGIPGQSKNITIRRIVDRYLEHPRVFVFHNNGNKEYYMGSADWMSRNLHSRIEVCFPLYDQKLSGEIDHILELQLKDNLKAVIINAELENIPVPADGASPLIAAQESIYNYVKQLNSSQI